MIDLFDELFVAEIVLLDSGRAAYHKRGMPDWEIGSHDAAIRFAVYESYERYAVKRKEYLKGAKMGYINRDGFLVLCDE